MHFLARTMVIWLGLGLLFCDLTQRRNAAAANQTPTFRGTPVRAWIDRLKDKEVAVRLKAATALAQGFDKAEPSAEAARAVLPVLFEALKDTDADVRRRAALAWVRFNGSI